MQAFDTCEEDGETGLTWAEIEQCEVKGTFERVDMSISINTFFQETYCALLTVECPTLEEFTAFDDNQDGILTVQEWMEGNMEAAN